MTAALPRPRNIRRSWKPGALELAQCAAEVEIRCPIPERYGDPVEARCWVVARGWQKGLLKRVDVAYRNDAGEVRFASVRLGAGRWTLRLGHQAAV